MTTSMGDSTGGRHLLTSETRPRMARAHLRKPETDTWRLAIAEAIAEVKGALTLKEFACALDREERQVARWMSGDERPQLDVIFAVEALRQPMLVALAELAGAGVEVTTQITVRRRIA